ncbi:MAG: hypothetical protein U1C12_01890, partial [Patescibacteria group bacterium]|nr:hypothetical protein [Patescibacteria group bacterium]
WFYSANILGKSTGSTLVTSQLPSYKPESVSVGSTIKTGIYKLEGYNSSLQSNPNYEGEIEISKNGERYELAWIIGQQDQRGVGLLEGNILSVGYTDITGGDIQDVGVVSYRVVNPGKLEGKWNSVSGTGTGREVLTWKSSF